MFQSSETSGEEEKERVVVALLVRSHRHVYLWWMSQMKESGEDFTGEERARLREVLREADRRRWLRERAGIWLKWAMLLVPAFSLFYTIWQSRGGR